MPLVNPDCRLIYFRACGTMSSMGYCRIKRNHAKGPFGVFERRRCLVELSKDINRALSEHSSLSHHWHEAGKVIGPAYLGNTIFISLESHII